MLEQAQQIGILLLHLIATIIGASMGKLQSILNRESNYIIDMRPCHLPTVSLPLPFSFEGGVAGYPPVYTTSIRAVIQ